MSFHWEILPPLILSSGSLPPGDSREVYSSQIWVELIAERNDLFCLAKHYLTLHWEDKILENWFVEVYSRKLCFMEERFCYVSHTHTHTSGLLRILFSKKNVLFDFNEQASVFQLRNTKFLVIMTQILFRKPEIPFSSTNARWLVCYNKNVY